VGHHGSSVATPLFSLQPLMLFLGLSLHLLCRLVLLRVCLRPNLLLVKESSWSKKDSWSFFRHGLFPYLLDQNSPVSYQGLDYEHLGNLHNSTIEKCLVALGPMRRSAYKWHKEKLANSADCETQALDGGYEASTLRMHPCPAKPPFSVELASLMSE